METIRILIADDHTLFRKGVWALLDSMPAFSLIGEATDGVEAVAKTEQLQPDVVLMDIQMPALNGIEATRQIMSANPHVGVIMLTMFDDDDSVFAAMRAGARGYVLKGADQAEMTRVIEAAARGEALFGAGIAERLMGFFAVGGSHVKAFPELTDREREILALIGQGLNNASIARRLTIAEKTVRNHINNIFSKLHIADRADAIIRAREQGLE